MSASDSHLNYREDRTVDAKRVEGECESDSASSLCDRCGHINPSGSKFCTECGFGIADTQTCPKCRAIANPGMDICEQCGTWLLRGKCKFCLTDVAEDDVFCGSCGNPQAGIACPRCGTLSIFDFCRKCDIPLSREAHEQASRAKADPAQQELLVVLQEIAAIDGRIEARRNEASQPSAAAGLEKDQFLQMRLVRERAASESIARTESVPQRKALFSANQQEQIGLLGAQIHAEEERKRLEAERLRVEAERRRKEEEERRRKLLEQVGRVLHEMSAKTFSSSQEARRYYMSLISALPEEVRENLSGSGSLRWRCNFANVEHDDPGQCGGPSHGGVWLFR